VRRNDRAATVEDRCADRTLRMTTLAGHVATVDALVIDPLSAAQVRQRRDITTAILGRLDPEDRFATGS
jgi:hypothetical protein